jgi:hypothetical protein
MAGTYRSEAGHVGGEANEGRGRAQPSIGAEANLIVLAPSDE